MIPISACILALALAAPGQVQSQSAGAHYRISGIVVNANTGQLLPKTEVTIGRAAGPESVQGVTTAEDGRFQFENLPAGKYWLQAQHTGFVPQRFNQHEDFSTAIAVGTGLQSEDLVFRVVPDASIIGTITDEQNEPVRNATVFLFRTGLLNGTASTHMRQATTDDQGRYRLSHLRPGTFLVAVSAQPWYAEFGRAQRVVAVSNADGVAENEPSSGSPEEAQRQSEFDVTYPITFYPGVTDASGATPIVVKAGDHVAADIALNPVPALHLHISDPSIDPSRGANLMLTQRVFGTFEVPVSAQTTEVGKGEAELGGVPPGQFTVSFINFRPSGETPTGRRKNVELSDDAQIDLSDSSTAPSISGVVRLDGGHPLSQPALIHFSNRTANQGFGAQTSGNGEFQVREQNVQPGKYEVSILGSNALLKTISAPGVKVSGHSIEIASGASVHLELTVAQGVGRVDGTALRDGKPFAGAMIVLVPRDIENNSTLVRRDQSDSDGTFTLQNVLPGEYTVVALENGWDLEWMSPAVLQPYLTKGEPVSVAVRQRYDVKVMVQ